MSKDPFEPREAHQPVAPAEWSAPDPSERVEGVATAPPSRAARRRRVAIGMAALTLAAAGLGVGAAAAATSESPGSGSGSSSTPSGEAGEHRGMGHRGFMGGPGGRSLHGEFVVETADGYQTLLTQRGDVKSVSSSSITVTSADGFDQTYAVTADTLVNAARDGIDTIAEGDTVMIVATVDGEAATAVSIHDATKVAAGMKRFAPPADSATTQPDASSSSSLLGSPSVVGA